MSMAFNVGSNGTFHRADQRRADEQERQRAALDEHVRQQVEQVEMEVRALLAMASIRRHMNPGEDETNASSES